MDVSRLKGIRNDPPAERRRRVAEAAGLPIDMLGGLADGGIDEDAADRLIENVVGRLALPVGIGLYLRVNGREIVVPMAIEEPSVVAGMSNAARMLAAGGGVTAVATEPLMIAQVQILDAADPEAAAAAIRAETAEILEACNAADPTLVSLGGGARELEVRRLDPVGPDDPLPPMLVVHLIIDVRDAMGANTVNTMAERVAPRLAELAGGRRGLRILSNLADRRTVTVSGEVPCSALAREGYAGPAVARGIEEASVFAERDPYRAATHNKGIMNGIDAVLVATGQDWRAVEAGAHAYAARAGRYGPLAVWRHQSGSLRGSMTLPLAVGIVGGAVKVHRTVQANLRILGITTARELAETAAAVGLAQNLAALRALAAEGIQAGHMRLHARKG